MSRHKEGKTVGSVVVLKSEGKVDLLDAYRQVIAEGYNSSKTYNKRSVQVMIGFLSAAFIALRVVGHEYWAQRFEHAGQQLERNWMLYPEVVFQLCMDIDNR